MMIHFDVCQYVLLLTLLFILSLKDGITALHVVAQEGHLEVVRLLLDRHANIEAVGNVSHNVSIASTYFQHLIILCTVFHYVLMLLQ